MNIMKNKESLIYHVSLVFITFISFYVYKFVIIGKYELSNNNNIIFIFVIAVSVLGLGAIYPKNVKSFSILCRGLALILGFYIATNWVGFSIDDPLRRQSTEFLLTYGRWLALGCAALAILRPSSSYVRMVRLREAAGNLNLVNARDGGEIVQKVRRLGYDLDEGMVLVLGNKYYHGSDCIHAVALLSSSVNFANKINMLIFRSRTLSKYLYPVLRSGRNLVIKLLGHKPLKEYFKEVQD